jgi:KDO2-lipid IV(A) lauroyltransferase
LKRVFPEKSDAEIEAILLEVWENLGRTAAEYPHLARLQVFDAEGRLVDGRIEVRGGENVDAALARGKPIIFFAAHLANWELPSLVALRYGVPIHLVYRAASNPWIEELFRAGRRDIAGGIPKGAEGRGSRSMREAGI